MLVDNRIQRLLIRDEMQIKNKKTKIQCWIRVWQATPHRCTANGY